MDAEQFARHYLEDLLSFFGLNTKVDVHKEDHTIQLDIPSTRLNGFLIGSRGENLRSLQHLANMALKRAGHEDLMAVVDIAGYRRQHNERLANQAKKLAGEVVETGKTYTFDFLSAYERQVVHKALAEVDGVATESVGEGHQRRLSIIKT